MGTVINIRAGGRTQVSGVIRAGILLSLVLGLAKYVEVIPHACLAGILLKVGWDIIDWRFLRRIVHVQREHLVVMATTLLLTVFVDLVTAVAIGLIAAGMATSPAVRAAAAGQRALRANPGQRLLQGGLRRRHRRLLGPRGHGGAARARSPWHPPTSSSTPSVQTSASTRW